MKEDHSERPPSLRQTEFRDDGTLVTTEHDPHGRVVRQSYYWSPDRAQLMRILAGLRQTPARR